MKDEFELSCKIVDEDEGATVLMCYPNLPAMRNGMWEAARNLSNGKWSVRTRTYTGNTGSRMMFAVVTLESCNELAGMQLSHIFTRGVDPYIAPWLLSRVRGSTYKGKHEMGLYKF